MAKIVQCVPNFSEGRNLEVVEKIVEPLKNKEGVKLLSYEPDKDYNRMVVTVIGEPEAVKKAVLEAIGVATELIDMNKHEGQHSRMGATDVVPFIPIRNITMEETVEIARDMAKQINEKYDIPIFLYEDAASTSNRKNLAKVRKGQFEKMPEKLKEEEWEPDFGKREIHKTAGVTAVGARKPLVAYNIDLDTKDVDIANKISKAIRGSSGGYKCIKAGGVELPEKGITQVTMNLVDYSKTAIYQAMEAVKMEAKRYGVNVIGSEVIGMVPMEALIESAMYYLKLRDFDMDKVLESHIME